MKKIISLAIVLFICALQANAQTNDMKEVFLEAESYFLFEEYNEALPLYLRLSRANPDNDNVNYKIGVCFLNDPFQRDKSLRYLEKAKRSATTEYKDNNFKEHRSPLETYFFLGKAYLVNENIDKALENFTYFKEISDPDVYDIDLVDEQIKICEQARYLMRIPVDFDRTNLSETINGRFSDINPVVSGDGNSMIFVKKLQFYDAAFYTQKIDGQWQAPRNIVPELGVDGDVYPTALSWSGDLMIIYRNDEFVGNLYLSRLVDGTWTKMTKLENDISTKYWESHGALSKDGESLYFTSNRKGGFGGLDIYKASRTEDGTWGNPVNLGQNINSRYNEETPFMTENMQMLFFSSYGHYNMGGYDVFFSKLDKEGNWAPPINLGYPINTTDDETFYLPKNNGDNGYFAVFGEDGFGREDLYYYAVYSENNPRMYLISGSLSGNDEVLAKGTDIYLVDNTNGDTILLTHPDLQQNFDFKAKQGAYRLVFRNENYEDLIKEFSIDETTNKAGIRFTENIRLTPIEKQVLSLRGEDSKVVPKDSIYEATEGEEIDIKLKVVKGSELIADVFRDSSLLESDTFLLERKNFNYKFTPLLGDILLQFRMIEPDGTVSISSVNVTGKPRPLVTEPVLEENLEEPEIEQTSESDSLHSSGGNWQPIVMSDPEIEQSIEYLKKHSDGYLKASLEKLDHRAEELTNADELLKYLEQNANREGYTQQDIDIAVGNAVSGGEAPLLHKLLYKHGNTVIRNYISSPDFPMDQLQSDLETYVRYLRRDIYDKPYSNEELSSAFASSLNEISSEAALLRLQLFDYATPELTNILQRIDLNGKDIHSKKELYEYLEQSGVNPIDIQKLFLHESTQNNAETLRAKLLQHSSGELFDILKKLDLKKEGITSAEELIDYLYKHTGRKYSQESLNQLLKKASTQISEVEKALLEMSSFAIEELGQYLEDLDLIEMNIYTRRQLLDHLIQVAGEEFSHTLLTNVLLDLMEDGAVDELYEYLLKNASESFQKFLMSLDLKELGISTPSELIAYIHQNWEKLGLSQDEFNEVLNQLLADYLFDTYTADDPLLSKENRKPWLWILWLAAGAGFFYFFIIYKRRKEEEADVN